MIDQTSSSYAEGQTLIKTNRENLCKTLVLKAKAAIAVKDFIGASLYLKAVNPDTSCLNEAQELIKDLETKFTVEDKRNWDLKVKQIQDQVDLKKDENSAIKEIAVAYVKSQPATMTYNTVIK